MQPPVISKKDVSTQLSQKSFDFESYRVSYLKSRVSELQQKFHSMMIKSDVGTSLADIDKLKYQLRELTEAYQFICGKSSAALNITENNKKFINRYIQRQTIPLEFPAIEINEREYIFYTLTFDPDKFGVNNQPEDEKNYLLFLITQLISQQMISSIYGSFEYQKNGAIHAHFISKFEDYGLIHNHFKRGLTNRPRNNKAVLIKPVNGLEKLWRYINKESNDYFSDDFMQWQCPNGGLDYDCQENTV